MHSLARDGEQLFHDYSGPVYRYCLARLSSREEAEDAVQMTYLNAWRSLQRGTDPVEPRPWLFTIAANVCATILRNRLRGPKVEVRAPEDFDRLACERSPDDEFVDLDAAVKALPARQREALLLRDWRGLSYEEIATELTASRPAVETLLFRARKAVAASLGKSAQRVQRAPLRSTLSAVLSWPSAFSGLRSSLTGSAATVKVAFGIALGATAPLVAFGVLEGTLGKHDAESTKRDSAPAAGFAFDAPLVREPFEGPPPLGAAASRHDKPANRPAGKRDAQPTPTSLPHANDGGSGAATEPSPPPAAVKDPPAEPQTGAGLVVICHVTGSEKKPDVTVSVAAAAVDVHLGHGDRLGPCAG